MQRRHFLALGGSSLGATLTAPRLAGAQGKGQGSRTLRFIPHADLAVLDPVFSAAYVTRNHAYLVYDTLFGQDAAMNPQPQMVEGVLQEDDGRRWTLTLREGLRFHDGTPVLARDCVASIRRWGQKDDLGKALLGITDELAAPDDRRIVFRLRQPYPLLPFALGKTPGTVCAMMPARIAETPVDRAVTEVVGSGPFRFLADERVAGDRVAYARFEAYVPRSGGRAEGTAGPKVAHFDRIEWKTISDATTAAAALRTGEVDWWELPSNDMLPLFRGDQGFKVEPLDPTGYMVSLRVNHVQGPTANPAIRRALMTAMSQRDVVMAIAGTDPALWNDRVGFFCPGTAMANETGMEALRGDQAAARKALEAADYKGEKVLLMTPADVQLNAAGSAVVADTLRRSGVNVDEVTMDWGTLLQRRNRKDPIEQGGWSAYVVLNTGADLGSPAVHPNLRGDGRSGLYGWCESPALEALRTEWLATSDPASQLALAKRMQGQAFQDLPYLPLGQVAQLTVYRAGLSGVLKGVPVFWNLRRG
ncbi:ABC transporter substrate-binding protein [Roseomonas mucosa]|uniref:ABC transporter substrate-binding protein n=1 Tax=Roseomonas mucosa TaxID=207340 RepID=A0A1S8D4J1_9PROT|nr:ABC transporter substrate-binding protein [Roseomonas mucosa]ONH82869.1 ABC transporter substrate-binding protein [Roseomonas mucosa]